MYSWKRCRDELILLGKLVDPVCNEAYFKLYSIFDREPVEVFQLRGNVRVFRGTDDNPAVSFGLTAIFLNQNQ